MKPIIALGALAAVLSARAQQSVWGQCGGIGWTGPTTCASGSTCVVSNPYYSQCLPGSNTVTTAHTTTPTTAQHTTTSTTKAATTSISCSSNSPPSSAGRLTFVGVNIAGFDFGCGTDGTCNLGQTTPPSNGASQMQHFVKNDGMNIFRLPVAWQYLASSPGGPLNQGNLANYDNLVQSCLSTGAYCIIDIHNYARWNGAIIGQGGPTNAQFATFWGLLAAKYASQSRIMFGIMNEPHDVPNISTWAATVQAAVTAIRNAGANSQYILLPGNNYTSAAAFISNGSAAALSTVTNPNGSTTNLIFDVHKYLDSDNSGTHAECTENGISDAWQPLAQWLRCHGRQAINTETGGGNTASCQTDLCQEVAYQRQNSDVILGVVGWAAGSFASSYVLSETPTQSGSTWTDSSLVKACLANAH